MRIPSKRSAAVILAAAIVGVGAAAGGALAERGPGKGRVGPGHVLKQRLARGVLRTAAEYLGLAPKALREQLRAGKSLAEVAAGQDDKSVDGLKQAILDAAKTRLDKAVAAGRISAERAQTVIGKLAARLDTLVNRKRSPK